MERVKNLNNKGFIGYLARFLIMFFLMSIGIGIIYAQNNPTLPIQNITEAVKWKDISEVSSNNSIVQIIYKNVNALGFSVTEVAKEGVKWGYAHPETNWKLLVYLTLIAILSPILIALIKLFAIVFIFIKDFISSHRERKELKVLREKRYGK